MTVNLVFPVKFDLEAAVKAAQGDADRLLRRLQTTTNAKQLAVNLKIDDAGSDSINEINSWIYSLDGSIVISRSKIQGLKAIHNDSDTWAEDMSYRAERMAEALTEKKLLPPRSVSRYSLWLPHQAGESEMPMSSPVSLLT